jgi:hypothetical protein
MAELLRTGLLLAGLTFGGSCAGLAVTVAVGGGNWQATLLGLLLLPLALAAALTTWRITYTVRGCLIAVFHLFSGKNEAAAARLQAHPRGGVSLVLVPTLICAIGGLLLSLLSPLPSELLLGGYAAGGAAYGLLLLLLARAGALDDLIWREVP